MNTIVKSIICSIAMLSVFSCTKPSGGSNFTLSYDGNGATGGSVPASVTAEKGTAVKLSDAGSLIKDGYTFSGWNSNADGTGDSYSPGDNVTLGADMTLYAKWQSATANKLIFSFTSSTFTVTIYDNASTKALVAKLPMTVRLTQMNGNEYYSYLTGTKLPSAALPVSIIQEGDFMLYGDDCLVIFYKTFTSGYSYTRLGYVDNPSGLQKALESGSVTIKLPD
jgi:uncharacterized repeat protein (TIGR02543 family)